MAHIWICFGFRDGSQQGPGSTCQLGLIGPAKGEMVGDITPKHTFWELLAARWLPSHSPEAPEGAAARVGTTSISEVDDQHWFRRPHARLLLHRRSGASEGGVGCGRGRTAGDEWLNTCNFLRVFFKISVGVTALYWSLRMFL